MSRITEPPTLVVYNADALALALTSYKLELSTYCKYTIDEKVMALVAGD